MYEDSPSQTAKSPTLKIISHGQLNDKILKKYKLSVRKMDLN